MINQTLKFVPTADNQQIAIWELTDADVASKQANNKQTLLFIHGAFSDKGVCLGIASYFVSLGFQCYIMEWRGHGSSSQPQTNYNLEDIGLYDVQATLSYLLDDLRVENLHCVTHSGGGICLTMCLTQYPEYVARINSITMFACQVFAAATTPFNFLKILTLKAITGQLGIVKGKPLKLGSMNESYYLLSQWMDWNLNQNFRSYTPTPLTMQLLKLTRLATKRHSLRQSKLKQNKTNTTSQIVDYRSLMPNITTPIYAIGAAGDSIAPPDGCLQYLQAFKNSKNQWRNFSVANGDLDDYSHTRIFLSRHAAKEVWPTALDWIDRHC